MTNDELRIHIDMMLNYCMLNGVDYPGCKSEKASIILHDLMQREVIHRKDDQLNTYKETHGVDHQDLSIRINSMKKRIENLEMSITHLISACEDKSEEMDSLIMLHHIEAVVNHAKDVLYSEDH